MGMKTLKENRSSNENLLD